MSTDLPLGNGSSALPSAILWGALSRRTCSAPPSPTGPRAPATSRTGDCPASDHPPLGQPREEVEASIKQLLSA